MTERILVAHIDDRVVGTLRGDQDIWSFGYDARWLADPTSFALSPALPLGDRVVDGSTRRPVQWFFDNLLPEEAQRTLMARDAGIRNEGDAFALLVHYGAESAGSLTLLPPGVALAQPSWRPLSDDALSARIAALPRVPLSHEAPKKMSLAGAQHKLAVVLANDALLEPAGPAPSTHILKPAHQDNDTYPHSVINEWFMMTLAGRLGLPVPAVHRRYVPEPVYIVDRFDRQAGSRGWERLHSIDACQMLNLSRTFKYDQGSLEALIRLAALCRAPALARARLFDWLAFNLMTGNGDAHLKNLSFLASGSGVALAPFYDLLSEAAYATPALGNAGWPDVRLAWPLPGAAYFRDVSFAVLHAAAVALGLAPHTATRRLAAMRDAIVPAAKILYAEVEATNAALAEQRPQLAATLAGELRCLRVIVHTIIGDMVRQLS